MVHCLNTVQYSSGEGDEEYRDQSEWSNFQQNQTDDVWILGRWLRAPEEAAAQRK